VVRRTCLGRLAAALLGAAAAALVHAQPEPPTTEAQARYYVYGAFLTHAVPEILGERVALGPELEQRLGVSSGADHELIYDALMIYTDERPIRVRKATSGEVAKYRPTVKRELREPLFAVQAGEITLLVQYDMQSNTIPFIGQLAVAYQPQSPAARPIVERRAAPAAAASAAPKPEPVRASVPPPPPPPVREALGPNGPCVVKPVMSEQDLANCRAARSTTASAAAPPPPAVVKPQARVAPPPPPQRARPCEVKPVMTEEDLANCRAVSVLSARVQPGPPAVVKPQPRVEPEPPRQRTGPCVVKPVMTEEDLANCRAAPGGSARVDPGPPAVARPQARVEPAPQPRRAAPCEIKPVMSEEDLAACGIRR